jgi:hypothetical protein
VKPGASKCELWPKLHACIRYFDILPVVYPEIPVENEKENENERRVGNYIEARPFKFTTLCADR